MTSPAASLVRHVYFPSAIYTATRPDFLAAARSVFDEHITEATRAAPAGAALSSAEQMFNAPRLAAFTHFIATSAWAILDGQGHDMRNKATYFTDMWGQRLGRHAAMAEHLHPGAQIVGLYFLNAPPAAARLRVHDPRPGKVMASLPEKDGAPPSMASSLISITPEPGMVFFANAWLPHSLTQHGAEEPLSFIHFNVGVQQAPPRRPAGVVAAEVI